MQIEHLQNVEISNEISKIIETVTHVGTYKPGMCSDDSFIYFLPQGIPFAYADITALQQSGEQLITDLRTLDKLYLFTQLTNHIFICDSTVSPSTQKIENIYIGDKELHELTSPTYNNRFLLSIPYPTAADTLIGWSHFSHQSYSHHKIKVAKKTVSISIPYFKATGKFRFLYICRPWLQPYDLVTAEDPLSEKKAIIEGIILVQDLTIQVMNTTSKVKIFKKKQYQIIDNPISMKVTYPDAIIGYYCRIF